MVDLECSANFQCKYLDIRIPLFEKYIKNRVRVRITGKRLFLSYGQGGEWIWEIRRWLFVLLDRIRTLFGKGSSFIIQKRVRRVSKAQLQTSPINQRTQETKIFWGEKERDLREFSVFDYSEFRRSKALSGEIAWGKERAGTLSKSAAHRRMHWPEAVQWSSSEKN